MEWFCECMHVQSQIEQKNSSLADQERGYNAKAFALVRSGVALIHGFTNYSKTCLLSNVSVRLLSRFR